MQIEKMDTETLLKVKNDIDSLIELRKKIENEKNKIYYNKIEELHKEFYNFIQDVSNTNISNPKKFIEDFKNKIIKIIDEEKDAKIL